jgi:dihydroneopterin aldolase
VHFTLIEAVADHIMDNLFADDPRISHLVVKIVKLAIAEDNEAIGITMSRSRK